MQNQKVIEQLGYSPKEAKVYLASLGLGEAHISDIAAKVKMPRSSVQMIVDKLHKDGLMTFYVMRRYKYWVAENPERLLADLKRQEDRVLEALPLLQDIRKRARSNNRNRANDSKELSLFRMIADSSMQPVLIANEAVEIEYVNAAWEEQFGYNKQEVQGKNPKLFQSGKTPREIYERMWKALGNGHLFQSDEIVDKRRDGTFFNLTTTIFPLTHNGRTFYVQILEDDEKLNHAQNLRKSFSDLDNDER